MSSDLYEEVRRWSKASLYFFATAVLGFDRMVPRLHLPACNYIQLLPDNCGIPQSRRKMMWMPREHFKSTICSIAFPLWLLCHDRNTTIALISAVEKNTKKWLRQLKQIILYNKMFRWTYPEIRPGGKWDELEIEITRDVKLAGEAQASITASSITSGQASQHYQHIILDDPVNEKVAASEALMGAATDLYIYLESLLRDWETSTFTLVGTPWGRGDVLEYAMEHDVKNGERLFWGIGARGEFRCSEQLRDQPELIPQYTEGQAIFEEECPEAKLKHLEDQDVEKYCNPAGAPILLSNFRERAIEDVKVGDEVVGFTRKGYYDCFVPSEVLSVGKREHEVVKIKFESGKEIRCTPSHRWFKGWKDYKGLDNYTQAEKNSSIFCVDWQREENDDWVWLRGFLDGEGSLNHANYIGVSQSYRWNLPVCTYLEGVLERLGISYSSFDYEDKGLRLYNLKGGRRLRLKLMSGKMAKRSKLLEHMFTKSRQWTGKEKVVSITPDGNETVYSLQTSTGNYIVWGLASSNSLQYLCKPYDSGRAGFNLSLIRDFTYGEDGFLKCQCHPEHKHDIREMSVIGLCDPAVTARATACRSAVVVAALSPCGCRFLLDEWAQAVDPAVTIEKLLEMGSRWSGHMSHMGIEANAWQKTMKSWLQTLKNEGKFPGSIVVEPLKPDGREKNARIKSQLWPVKNGLWHKRAYMAKSDVEKNFMWELSKWPYGSKRDLIDAGFGYCEDIWSKPDAFKYVNRDGGQPFELNRLREVADLRLLEAESA